MNENKDQARSPCIETCILNDKNICLGCFRSLAEIAQWQQMDAHMRLDVLRIAEKRRKTYDAIELD